MARGMFGWVQTTQRTRAARRWHIFSVSLSRIIALMSTVFSFGIHRSR